MIIEEVIACCKKLYQVTNEKIGVGILMFDKYQTKDGKSYTLTPKKTGRNPVSFG